MPNCIVCKQPLKSGLVIDPECYARIQTDNAQLKAQVNAAYKVGADYAFYELCKELSIGSQDIRESNATIDEKAARLAERIVETLRDKTD